MKADGKKYITSLNTDLEVLSYFNLNLSYTKENHFWDIPKYILDWERSIYSSYYYSKETHLSLSIKIDYGF